MDNTADLPEILDVKIWHLDMGYLLKIGGGLTKRNMFVKNLREARKEINKYIALEFLNEAGGD